MRLQTSNKYNDITIALRNCVYWDVQLNFVIFDLDFEHRIHDTRAKICLVWLFDVFFLQMSISRVSVFLLLHFRT